MESQKLKPEIVVSAGDSKKHGRGRPRQLDRARLCRQEAGRATGIDRINPALRTPRKDAKTQGLFCEPVTPDLPTGPGCNNQ